VSLPFRFPDQNFVCILTRKMFSATTKDAANSSGYYTTRNCVTYASHLTLLRIVKCEMLLWRRQRIHTKF